MVNHQTALPSVSIAPSKWNPTNMDTRSQGLVGHLQRPNIKVGHNGKYPNDLDRKQDVNAPLGVIRA